MFLTMVTRKLEQTDINRGVYLLTSKCNGQRERKSFVSNDAFK